jgi:hypothetical protein
LSSAPINATARSVLRRIRGVANRASCCASCDKANEFRASQAAPAPLARTHAVRIPSIRHHRPPLQNRLRRRALRRPRPGRTARRRCRLLTLTAALAAAGPRRPARLFDRRGTPSAAKQRGRDGIVGRVASLATLPSCQPCACCVAWVRFLPGRAGCVCTWIHHALGMGSLADARTALASELRAASLLRPWCFDYGPQAAASAHVTRARRRTGSRRRRMEQR